MSKSSLLSAGSPRNYPIFRVGETLLQVGNLVAFVVTVVINTLANALPLNGKNTGELSDNIPNLFVPAGLTFAIWGVIYFLLGVFALYQARDLLKSEKLDTPYLDRIGPWFIVASAGNIAWVFLWHWEQVLASLFAMLVLLAGLLVIYLRLDIGGAPVDRPVKLAVHVPFSVYLGWITVATIANVTAVLVTSNLASYGLSEATWTILVIVVGAVIAGLMLWTREDYAYSAVVVWAYLGILIKRLDPAFAPQVGIVVTAAVAIVAIVVLGVVVALRARNK